MSKVDVITSVVSTLDQFSSGHGQAFLNEWYTYIQSAEPLDERKLIVYLTNFWRSKIARIGVEDAHDLFNWLDQNASPEAWCSVFHENIAPGITWQLTTEGW